MGVLFSGVVHVTGEPDTGKTVFAFSCGAQPEDIVFIDDDVKGRSVVDAIEAQGKSFGYYKDLVAMSSGMKEISFHNEVLKMIDELEEVVKKRKKKFECLIWDTWTRFETTFHPMVVTKPLDFRSYWSPNGAIKGAEQWKESFKYEAEVINRLQGVAKMVILTTHLKPENIAGRKTGKFVADAKVTLTQKSLLRVYLRHNPDGPEPIGLVLKRISKQVVGKDGIEIISILPRKIKPFTWAKIREYWENPVGSRPPTKEELPDDFELSILDGSLTEDQKMIMHMYDTAPLMSDEDDSLSDEVAEKVHKLNEAGMTKPKIAKELGISVKDVVGELSK